VISRNRRPLLQTFTLLITLVAATVTAAAQIQQAKTVADYFAAGSNLQGAGEHEKANHGLGLVYAVTGNRTGAMQQYYILQNISPDIAADLLRSIPK